MPATGSRDPCRESRRDGLIDKLRSGTRWGIAAEVRARIVTPAGFLQDAEHACGCALYRDQMIDAVATGGTQRIVSSQRRLKA
jgi:hypothetical protein